MDNRMKTLKLSLIFALATFVVACGGDLDDDITGTDSTMRDFSLRLTPSQTTLSPGGQLTILAEIFNRDVPYLQEPVEIQFESSCAPNIFDEDGNPLPGSDENKASITPRTVKTGSGKATVTYRDKGCPGSDRITARAPLGDDGEALVAYVDIEISSASPGALEFKSAEPASIGIEGSGLPQQSTLIFVLKDNNGHPIANKEVKFALENAQGNAHLVQREALSDRNGEVSTVLRAGTTPMTARVIATALTNSGYELKTQADAVAISTGVSSQERFSISVDNMTPEAGQCDGAPIKFTVRAADRNGYPVHGQRVQFSAEAGKIDDSCTLRAPTIDDEGNSVEGSVCTVIWISQGQRPYDGRMTVLATMEGEETFTDNNGNKRYDSGEPFVSLTEAWRDDNENGVYNLGEYFVDANGNGRWDNSTVSRFKGTMCTDEAKSAGHCAAGVDVRDSMVIIMANSNLEITAIPDSFNLTEGQLGSGIISVCSVHGTGAGVARNYPPAGTELTISTGSGDAIKDASPSALITPASNAKACYVTHYNFQAEKAGQGILYIEAATPGEYCGSIINRLSVPVTVVEPPSP